jgi:hypothetical protein
MPQASTKLYAKLGISPDATPEAIEAAYRVLEKAYRPDGTYADDVMHQAFIEISSAAGILRNPGMRRLYDRNYIDESGRPTAAGLARAARARMTAIVCGASIAFIAGLFILNVWGPALEVRKKSIQAGPPPPQVAVTEPSSAALSPSLGAAAKTDANGAAAGPGDGAPAEANAEDYLPRGEVLKRKTTAANVPSERIQELRKPYRQSYRKYVQKPGPAMQTQGLAHNAERSHGAASSDTAAAELWQEDIWFPGSSRRSKVAASDSPTLKSAQCLACLTGERANCSKTCP